MVLPDTPKEQIDTALGEAWLAATKSKELLEANNGSSAAVWAASAQAWASIANAAAQRLQH
jgi:hypothetical protein